MENAPKKIEYNLKFLTEQDLRYLGIDDVWSLPHCAENEGGENLGVRGRKGAAGLPFYTEVIKMSDGTFKQRNRMDLTGKNPQELGYNG